jgi:hypothetical protein
VHTVVTNALINHYKLSYLIPYAAAVHEQMHLTCQPRKWLPFGFRACSTVLLHIYTAIRTTQPKLTAGDCVQQLHFTALLIAIYSCRCPQRPLLCSAVLALQPENLKAMFRRGQALSKMSRFAEAKEQLLTAAKADPKDKNIRVCSRAGPGSRPLGWHAPTGAQHFFFIFFWLIV